MQRLTTINHELEDRKRTHRDKSAPSFKPMLNEKSNKLANNGKTNNEHQGKFRELNSNQVLTRSFVDLSNTREDFATNEPVFGNHSRSPVRNRPKQNNKAKSPSKIYDVEYTPSMDFLLKKVSPNSSQY